MNTHYLELSNPGSGEHKFYEITEGEFRYTARYGRIGTQGQQKTFEFDSPEATQKAIAKALAEKLKKGYAPATPGQTDKQETRHQATLRQVKELVSLLCKAQPERVAVVMAGFKAFIEDPDNKDEYEDRSAQLTAEGLREAGMWEVLFSVDWKDTESMLDSLDTLCEAQGVTLTFDWRCECPEDDLDVEQIMKRAHHQLMPLGWQLWHWDRGSDSYEGWLAHGNDHVAIENLCLALGLEVRPVISYEED
jgi:predicted DNA-binding WGR domain protein